MYGILETANAVAQTVQANGILTFATNEILRGCAVKHVAGTSTVTMSPKGTYKISFTCDVTPAATSVLSVNVLNNNAVIETATVNGTEATATRIAMISLVNVLPSCPMVDNTANITVQCSAAASIANATLIVEKVI